MKKFTFYSYKGGVGRTTTLSNLAYAMIERKPNLKIALTDFDIESCGLYSVIDDGESPKSGKIFQNVLLADSEEDIRSLIEDSLVQSNSCENIFVMPAGIDPIATEKVNELVGVDKSKINRNVRKYIEILERDYKIDYLFFDSRAGISNMAEPAFLFADAVVILYRMGNQQQVGVKGLFKWLIDYYTRLGVYNKKFLILPSNIHESVSREELTRFTENHIKKTRLNKLKELFGENFNNDYFQIEHLGEIWQNKEMNIWGSKLLFGEQTNDDNVTFTKNNFLAVADNILKIFK